MKFNFFFPALLCLFLIACDGPSVTFESPQPIDVKNQDHFPKILMGKYINVSDSSVITITDKAITRGFNIKYVISKKELDTMKNCKVVNDTLYNNHTNEKTCIVNIHDTLYTPYRLQDTLFYISDKNILRKDRGYYFLNLLYRSKWEVQKLDYRNGKLSICSISDMEEIKNLKAITDNTGDTMVYFNPDKKQFRKFIKSKGFSKKEEFVRLR
ncbi:MAG TPA: hypothetical protein VLB84_09060 [Bacteroidia bacterium]|nr:hypothetical protein [Bacteroidia bacterium]